MNVMEGLVWRSCMEDLVLSVSFGSLLLEDLVPKKFTERVLEEGARN